MNTIDVTYDLGSTTWSYRKLLATLEGLPVVSFDTETEGVYTKKERKEAEKLLETANLPSKVRANYALIANNSGLSHPPLVRTTHFIFGTSNSHSIVLVTPTAKDELFVWNWVKKQKILFIIHNSLFDLKLMYHRIKAFPKEYTDTMLLAKCLVNNADNYKAKVGLKDLMGSFYKPAWALYDSYEPENLFDKDFLEYCGTDGAACFLLYEQLQEYTNEG